MKQFWKDAAVRVPLFVGWTTCTNMPLEKMSVWELVIVGVVFMAAVDIVRWGLKK